MKTILRRTAVLGLLAATTAAVAQPPAGGGRGAPGGGRGAPGAAGRGGAPGGGRAGGRGRGGAPQEQSLVTWEQAVTMMAAAEKYTNDKGWAMSVRIVDQNNNVLMIHRLNNVNPFTVDVTNMKTTTVTATKMTSGEYAEKLAAGEIEEVEGGANFAGGVPLYLNGQFIGAIAASGGAPNEDEEVAKAGAAAIGAKTSM